MPYTSHSGAFIRYPANIICMRWGGGAKLGHYHVCFAGWEAANGLIYSRQCVVDDFGDLVAVQ